MRSTKTQVEATLLDILIDGFEKNEILEGIHGRVLPLQSEEVAREKFFALGEEARRWKGEPTRTVDADGRRLAGWADLEIRQVGRGILVHVRAPWFREWWCDPATWEGDPMAEVYKWLADDDD